MTILAQIIAVEGSAKAEAEKARESARATLAQVPQMSGISRAYQPRDDDGDRLPPESTQVQVKADDVLRDVANAMARMLDVSLTLENGNASAAADVKVEGHVILAHVPVTYLLFLESRLAELHGFLQRLPLLDPAERWTLDEAAGCYRTDEARTVRNKKIPRNHVLSEATPQHPAQVQVYMEDIPVGEWSTVKFSGALPAARVRTLTSRCAELQRAVKFARHEANSAEVTDRRAGDAIFSYLLAE